MQLSICYRFCRNKTSPRQLYSCQFATGFAAIKPPIVNYTAVSLLQVLPQQNQLFSVIQLSVCYRFCRNKTSPRQISSCQFATGFAATKPALVSYTAVNLLQVLPQQNHPSSVIQLSICYRFCRNKTTSRQYTAVNLLQVLRPNT